MIISHQLRKMKRKEKKNEKRREDRWKNNERQLRNWTEKDRINRFSNKKVNEK